MSSILTKQIGKYRIRRTIGAGTYGTVVEATDDLLNRTVALKLLNSSATPELDLKRHLREARALASLRHPNIVTLFEFSQIDGFTVLAMEHVEGESLSERLARKRIPIDRALDIAWQLADALAMAHEQGIVHADIKPDNVILDRNGKPLLLDFGLAKFMARFGGDNSLLNTASTATRLHGTIPYMPPELFLGEQPDMKSDIYSFGAVLYEMFAGRRPFAAKTEGAVINEILNTSAAPIESLCPDLPADVAALVTKMLEPEPANRPATMATVRDRLSAVLGKALPKLTPWQHFERLWRHSVRNRMTRKTLLSFGAGVASILVVVAGLYFWDRSRSDSLHALITDGMDNVIHFEREGAIDEAVEKFQRALVKAPNNAAATAGLSLALVRKYTEEETDPSTLKQAQAAAELALSLDDQLALAHVAVALTAYHRKDFPSASSQFKIALELDPENPMALEGMAFTHEKMGERDEAISLYARAISEAPDYLAPYYNLGGLYFSEARYAEAEKLFEQCIGRSPDNVYGYTGLSAAQHMQGDTAKAISTIQKGLQIRPHPDLYNNLGTYLYFSGQYPQAAKAFEKLIEVEGNSHDYLNWGNLGDAYRWTPGKEAEARTAFRRALQLLGPQLEHSPNGTAMQSRAALYLAKSGDAEAAKKMIQRALTTESPRILFHTTMLYEIIGDRATALAYLKKALAAGYGLSEIESEPELAKLREDRRYHELMANLGERK